MSFSPLITPPPIYDKFIIDNNINQTWLRWINDTILALAPLLVYQNDTNENKMLFIQLPSLTTAQRDSVTNPPDGLIFYNSDIPSVQARVGGVWVNL